MIVLVFIPLIMGEVEYISKCVLATQYIYFSIINSLLSLQLNYFLKLHKDFLNIMCNSLYNSNSLSQQLSFPGV